MGINGANPIDSWDSEFLSPRDSLYLNILKQRPFSKIVLHKNLSLLRTFTHALRVPGRTVEKPVCRRSSFWTRYAAPGKYGRGVNRKETNRSKPQAARFAYSIRIAHPGSLGRYVPRAPAWYRPAAPGGSATAVPGCVSGDVSMAVERHPAVERHTASVHQRAVRQRGGQRVAPPGRNPVIPSPPPWL